MTDKRGKCRQGNGGWAGTGIRVETGVERGVERRAGTGVRGAAAEEAIAIHFKWVALVGGAVGARRGRGAGTTMDCWVAR